MQTPHSWYQKAKAETRQFVQESIENEFLAAWSWYLAYPSQVDPIYKRDVPYVADVILAYPHLGDKGRIALERLGPKTPAHEVAEAITFRRAVRDEP